MSQLPTEDYDPTAAPTNPLPPLRPEQIPATAFDVLNAMHQSAVNNFRQSLAPQLNFPSMWRLAKAVAYDLGPITIYRYEEEE